MTVVVPVALNPPPATSSLLPLVGVVFFFGAFLSVQASWSCYHTTFLSFTLLHGPIYYNPLYMVSVYHFFRLLWIIHRIVCSNPPILTLTVTLPVTVALQSLPPPFSQWCDGPHCGAVVILQYRTLFSWRSSEGCFFLSTSASLGLLISGLVFKAATKL